MKNASHEFFRSAADAGFPPESHPAWIEPPSDQEECGPDDVYDVEPADKSKIADALAALPPLPERIPTLAARARKGAVPAIVEWADRTIPSFPTGLVDMVDLPSVFRALSFSISSGSLLAKNVVGRWLAQSFYVKPSARFFGWRLLREAADAGFGNAWDEMGRTCMGWILFDPGYGSLEPFDPECKILPKWDDLRDFSVQCFRRATECGCAKGWNGLAWAAEEGIGTPDGKKDMAASEDFSRRGAEVFDSHSCFNLGIMLANRRESNHEKRISLRREALSLFARGAAGTDVVDDDISEATDIADRWEESGKVSDDSFSMRLFRECVERYYHNVSYGEEDLDDERIPSDEETEKRRKENRYLADSWADWLSRNLLSDDTKWARGRALLEAPNAAPAQLREGFGLVKQAADTTDSPEAWEKLAVCYEVGLGIYRNKNRAAKCRKIAGLRKSNLAMSEELFSSPGETFEIRPGTTSPRTPPLP